MPAQSEAVTLSSRDGGGRTCPPPVTGHDVAAAISPDLAKAAPAIRLDGDQRDLVRSLPNPAPSSIVPPDDPKPSSASTTNRPRQSGEALYSGVQVTIGAATEDGFARNETFVPANLKAMEQRMHEIVARNEPIALEVSDRGDTISEFEPIGEHFTPEIIRDLPDDGMSRSTAEGDSPDLCRGPPLPSTGKVPTAGPGGNCRRHDQLTSGLLRRLRRVLQADAW